MLLAQAERHYREVTLRSVMEVVLRGSGRARGSGGIRMFGSHPQGSMQAKDGVTEQDVRNCDERKAGSAWV
jgi:hypothetical protein